MQNYCKTIGALAAVSALVAGNVQAEVEYELHTGYSSEYLLRGVNIGADLVEAGADVKTEAYGLGLSAGALYNSFGSDADRAPYFGDNGNSTEIELYAEVAKDFGFLTGSVGYVYRTFDLASTDTPEFGEVYFGIARDFGCISASLTYNWNVSGSAVAASEGYTELALGHSFELSPCLALNVGTNVGYLVEGGDFTAWTTKVALDWGFAEHAKLSPFIAASVALGESTNTLWESTSNQLLGGAMLSVNF